MSELVRDSSGRLFQLRRSRGSGHSTIHLSLRALLERHVSINGVLDNDDNEEAFTRSLIDAGQLDDATARHLSFDELRRMLAAALSDGTLQVVPYVRELRPVCEVTKIYEAEPLISGPITELSANDPVVVEPPPWPGDAAAQADVLLRASESATPFCEVCEKARASA